MGSLNIDPKTWHRWYSLTSRLKYQQRLASDYCPKVRFRSNRFKHYAYLPWFWCLPILGLGSIVYKDDSVLMFSYCYLQNSCLGLFVHNSCIHIHYSCAVFNSLIHHLLNSLSFYLSTFQSLSPLIDHLPHFPFIPITIRTKCVSQSPLLLLSPPSLLLHLSPTSNEQLYLAPRPTTKFPSLAV